MKSRNRVRHYSAFLNWRPKNREFFPPGVPLGPIVFSQLWTFSSNFLIPKILSKFSSPKSYINFRAKKSICPFWVTQVCVPTHMCRCVPGCMVAEYNPPCNLVCSCTGDLQGLSTRPRSAQIVFAFWQGKCESYPFPPPLLLIVTTYP